MKAIKMANSCGLREIRGKGRPYSKILWAEEGRGHGELYDKISWADAENGSWQAVWQDLGG